MVARRSTINLQRSLPCEARLLEHPASLSPTRQRAARFGARESVSTARGINSDHGTHTRRGHCLDCGACRFLEYVVEGDGPSLEARAGDYPVECCCLLLSCARAVELERRRVVVDGSPSRNFVMWCDHFLSAFLFSGM